MVEFVIVLVILEFCDLMLPVCIHGIAVIASQSLRHLSEEGQSVRRSDEVGKGGQAGSHCSREGFRNVLVAAHALAQQAAARESVSTFTRWRSAVGHTVELAP